MWTMQSHQGVTRDVSAPLPVHLKLTTAKGQEQECRLGGTSHLAALFHSPCFSSYLQLLISSHDGLWRGNGPNKPFPPHVALGHGLLSNKIPTLLGLGRIQDDHKGT